MTDLSHEQPHEAYEAHMVTHSCDFCGGWKEEVKTKALKYSEEKISQSGSLLIDKPRDYGYAAMSIKTRDGVVHNWCEDCFYKALIT